MGQGVFKMIKEAIGAAWTSFAIEVKHMHASKQINGACQTFAFC